MDVTSVDAILTFDCSRRRAWGEATMRFTLGGGEDDLDRVWDLRQRILKATIDGRAVDVPSVELAPGATARLIPAGIGAGDHELVVTYEVNTPDAPDAIALGWTRGQPGLVFEFWMSDLHPGRYLEMWAPAPLCHDRFALSVEVVLEGTNYPHVMLANGAVSDGGLRVTYPASFTPLSPMLVLLPEARIETVERDGVLVATMAGPEIDLDAAVDEAVACLAHNAARFGPYCHSGYGEPFRAYLWASSRGMEYDGAFTGSVGSLTHEVFHSWIGRGVKPATASDGWIDEAITSWYTAGPPRQQRWAEPFDWDQAPCLLAPPAVARYTPREAYSLGSRLVAGFADALSVDGFCDAIAVLYRERAAGFLSTDDLCRALSEAGGRDLQPAFDRWVHGKDVGGDG